MSVRVEVKPQLLDWARARSGIDDESWVRRFPKFDEWRSGASKPTSKQLQEFARKTYTPVGAFFLDTPPEEPLPIADFRTIPGHDLVGGNGTLSANLLDTIYVCQRRQEWFRENQLFNREPPVRLVGLAKVSDAVEVAAEQLRSLLTWTSEVRNETAGSGGAVAELRDRAEAAGVLVMISGFVGSNTRRVLELEEFRGFALSDPYAPLVFVNGADAKAAQLFTLAHELAHILLGVTGVSDAEPAELAPLGTERWCNRVAAEFLVPVAELRTWLGSEVPRSQVDRLASKFRVSRQVIVIRMRDIGVLDARDVQEMLAAEQARFAGESVAKVSGGNYYNNKPQQVSRRFAKALISSAFEGVTPYTRAFRMLDVRKEATFNRLAETVGVR